jgi:hypothetical protein
VFIAQLHRRARLLNEGFHRLVFGLVAAHEAPDDDGLVKLRVGRSRENSVERDRAGPPPGLARRFSAWSQANGGQAAGGSSVLARLRAAVLPRGRRSAEGKRGSEEGHFAAAAAAAAGVAGAGGGAGVPVAEVGFLSASSGQPAGWEGAVPLRKVPSRERIAAPGDGGGGRGGSIPGAPAAAPPLPPPPKHPALERLARASSGGSGRGGSGEPSPKASSLRRVPSRDCVVRIDDGAPCDGGARGAGDGGCSAPDPAPARVTGGGASGGVLALFRRVPSQQQPPAPRAAAAGGGGGGGPAGWPSSWMSDAATEASMVGRSVAVECGFVDGTGDVEVRPTPSPFEVC